VPSRDTTHVTFPSLSLRFPPPRVYPSINKQDKYAVTRAKKVFPAQEKKKKCFVTKLGLLMILLKVKQGSNGL
jgi:hypothetical protein